MAARWKPAYNQALTAVLEDVRVFRVAKRIRGSQAEGVHLIEVGNGFEFINGFRRDPEMGFKIRKKKCAGN